VTLVVVLLRLINDGDDCGRHTHIDITHKERKKEEEEEKLLQYPCLKMDEGGEET
jgi:hypothetical protein